MENVYLDNAAATPIFPEALAEIEKNYLENYANTASSHLPAQNAAAELEAAREKIANFLGAENVEDIVFTSGGTESDNLAIKGAAMALMEKGKHIITSTIEHHAVLRSCEFLEKFFDYDVTYLEVDKNGYVDLSDLKNSIREDTVLISIIYANNEIGSIQEINKIGSLAEKNNIIFHTDAVQAADELNINVEKSKIDLLSISAHKFNGPKGVGALFVRKGTKLVPQMSGGSQERKRRAGTVNLPGIKAMAKAAEITSDNRVKKIKKLKELRNYFISKLKNNFTDIKINTPVSDCSLAANLNISFKDLSAESILFNLSLDNIAASAGSACASGSLKASHVLKAINLDDSLLKGTIRFSLSEKTKKSEIDYVIKKLKIIIDRINSLK